MKQKITVTIDEETAKSVELMLKNSLFRNRSHIIEHSLIRFLDENQNSNINEEGN